MKTSLILLLLVPLTAGAQYLNDRDTGDTLYWQPHIGPDNIRGGTLTDERGNVWSVQPNIGPDDIRGGTITRQRRGYRMLRDQAYRENE